MVQIEERKGLMSKRGNNRFGRRAKRGREKGSPREERSGLVMVKHGSQEV